MIRVTYLEHSGFFVETETVCLLFDYYKGMIPPLCGEKTLYVFISHGHHDHCNKKIFDLVKNSSDVQFILSEEVGCPESCAGMAEHICAGQTISTEDLEIRALQSTDLGVAYLVKVGTQTFYHAGDLNWWHWEGESDAYNANMEKDYKVQISEISGEKIDVAFVPVDPRLESQYCWGLDWFMRNTSTSHVFPMHFWKDYRIFEKLQTELCTVPYRDRIVRIEREGQEIILED